MIDLFKDLKPYKKYIYGILVLMFFQSISELFLPTFMADIVNNGIVNGNIKYIFNIGALMLLVSTLGTIAAVWARYLASKTAVGFGMDLRNELFKKVEEFSPGEFKKIGTSSLITRTTNDVSQMERVLLIILRMMVRAPMMGIGGIILAVSKDAKLSLVFLVAIPIAVLIIFGIAKKAMPLFKAMQSKVDNLNLILRERLTGTRVIRAFNRTDYEERRFNHISKDLTDTAIKVNRVGASLLPSIMLVLNFSIIAVIWFGSIRVDKGNMQVGDLMAFIQYAMLIMFSFIQLSVMFVMVPRASVSAERINEVLNIEPEIEDIKEIKNSKYEEGYVEFKNVTFRYPGAEESILSDISFNANPGEVIAIIGGTGSGKSTLANLIPRFYDIAEGSILVDGVDIRELSQESLRNRIGFVPQKSFLFTGTVAENIRHGKEDATDEEVRKSAEIAQASGFISNMKKGFDSIISQGGTNLSGGQKQRISIARALVRKPLIYIFDDSFSALDFKTDAKLRKALEDEIKESTVFIVAQRVSTIMDADKIIVLDKGRIAGIGTHEELIDTSDVYRETAYSQLSEEEIG